MATFLPSTEPPVPLPTPRSTAVGPGLALLPPLSRRGSGPGLVVLCPATPDSLAIVDGVPWPALKWAEEGFAVAEIQPAAWAAGGPAALQAALAALKACDACTPGKVGVVAYGLSLWPGLAAALASAKEVVGAVVYADASDAAASSSASSASSSAWPVPVLQHLGGAPPGGARTMDRDGPDGGPRYWYPNTASYRFAVPFQPAFHYATEAVSHTRSLTFLKPLVGGPCFDLERIWDEHTFYEFEDRSVEHTMSTMVQEPYVNHIPTLTGGIGRANLTAFYRGHFIFSNSPDTELELISRTIGIDRIVDEFIYKFTHDSVVDWMLPGIPPTHKKAEVPFTSVVNIRGDRLYHEHISWDQGTLLAQLGLLPDYLPYPYPVPGRAPPAPGQSLQYRLPIAGIESAAKLRERTAHPSNAMFSYTLRESQ